MNKKVLIIGLIWPEPNATAAGTRMLQLINLVQTFGYEIVFVSAAEKSNLSFDLESIQVSCLQIELNDSMFDKLISEINPEIVIFDRFLTEEQYGWRVEEACPNALRILDTEDLHLLRKSRELALKQSTNNWRDYLQNDIAKREIASIFRCDISLIISEYELSILIEDFKVPNSLLFHLPFIDPSYATADVINHKDFKDRNHFMTLGNFKHKPNADAAFYLRDEIWPLIKEELPESELHVYGAYPSNAIKSLENKKMGFYIKGWVSDKKEAYINHRVCLAPLRFGAGQKGKLLDAMLFGTPSVVSTFAAEGMAIDIDWNGFIADQPEAFAAKAIQLYKNQSLWRTAQKKGVKILRSNFNYEHFKTSFSIQLEELLTDLKSHRNSNFIGAMLMHHQLKSTKYLSKWIELKNSANNKIV